MAESHSIEYRSLAFLGFADYRVGDDGSVWTRKRRGGWKRLVPGKDPNGRLYVNLFPGKKRFRVHRLVLLAFVGPCPEGMEARHFPDPDPTNNNRSNLSWATKKINQGDRVVHGTDCRGERQGASRLKTAEVLDIRARVAAGEAQYAIAKEKGVTPQAIWRIVHGKCWRHLLAASGATVTTTSSI